MIGKRGPTTNIILDPNQIFGEYACEDSFDWNSRQHLHTTPENYQHTGIRSCHDIYLGFPEGVLTIVREREPAYRERWPIGGAIDRGLSTWESLVAVCQREVKVQVEAPAHKLGDARVFSNFDRQNTGKGMDATAWIFYIPALTPVKDIKLDEDHSGIQFIRPEDCTKEFLDELHPYVADFLPKALEVHQKHHK